MTLSDSALLDLARQDFLQDGHALQTNRTQNNRLPASQDRTARKNTMDHTFSPLVAFSSYLRQYHAEELTGFRSQTGSHRGNTADHRISRFRDTSTNKEVTRRIAGSLDALEHTRIRHQRPTVNPTSVGIPYQEHNLSLTLSRGDEVLLGNANNQSGYLGFLLAPNNPIHIDPHTQTQRDVNDPAYRAEVLNRYHRPVAVFAHELRRAWGSSLTNYRHNDRPWNLSAEVQDFQRVVYPEYRPERNGIVDALQVFQQYRQSIQQPPDNPDRNNGG